MDFEPNFYVGVVEDRKDPLKLGRARVRIVGLHTEDKSVLPTEDLPWAYKIQPTTSGAISGIGHSPVGVMEGTWVAVQFIDPEKQMPFIVGAIGGYPVKSEIDIEVEIVGANGTALPDFNPTDIPIPPPPLEENKRQAPPTGDGIVCAVVDVRELKKTYNNNVEVVGKALCDAGITNAFSIIAILGNVGKECKFNPVREDLYYKSVDRIRAIYPSTVKGLTDEQLQKYVKNSEALANLVYANRNGNGDEASGDGHKYRGGGYIQLTGKANYAAVGARIGVDLVKQPALVCDPEIAAKACAEYFIQRYGSAAKVNALTSYDEALKDITTKVNPGGVKNDLPKVQKIAALAYVVGSPNEIVVASDGSPITDGSGAPITTGGTGSGMVNNTGNQAFATPSNTGFEDPNKKYPIKKYLNEPDTNRLARNSKISDTIVYTKETARHLAVPKANNNGTWDQPEIPYNAKYPYNNVFQSESGHFLEFDDTENNERIHLYHKKGTYTEIDHNGTQVNFIVGDGYTIFERNGNVHVSGAYNITVEGAGNVRIENALDIEVHGTTTINLHNNANINVAKDLNITAGGSIKMKARNGIALDAERIDLNSGTAAGLPIITTKRETKVEYEPLLVNSRSDETSQDYEVFENDPASVREAYQNKMITEGLATKQEMDAPVVAKAETTPPANNAEEVTVECGIPSSKTEFTGNEVLSKYFKLSDLTAGYSRKLKQIGGTSPAQAFCNMKALSINVLDVLKARYPNMKINSGYRDFVPPGGSTTSQHMTGQAVDLSFPGVTREQLYNLALEIQKLIPYDQLLLEYASGPGWIHISYRTEGNRKQCFTMNHHKRVSKDLFTLVRVY